MDRMAAAGGATCRQLEDPGRAARMPLSGRVHWGSWNSVDLGKGSSFPSNR